MAENNVTFSQDSLVGLREMLDVINQMFEYSMEMFGDRVETHMDSIQALEDRTDEMEKELMAQHIDRLNKRLCTAEAGIYYSDVIAALERIADHLINIAFALDATRKQEKAALLEIAHGKIELK